MIQMPMDFENNSEVFNRVIVLHDALEKLIKRVSKLETELRTLKSEKKKSNLNGHEHKFNGETYSWRTNVLELEKRWDTIFQTRNLPIRDIGDSKAFEHELKFDSKQIVSHTDVNQITSNIWICNLDAATQPAVYEELCIGGHLILTNDSSFRYPYIHRLEINVRDEITANIYQFFDITYEFLTLCTKSGVNVLINCRAGISRSVTILLAYLMRRYDMTYEQAELYMRQKHPSGKPNPGFVTQLTTYRKELDALKGKPNLSS